MSKNVGKRFEEDIKSSIDTNDIFYYRIKDSATSWGNGDNSNVRFTPSNDFDCILVSGIFLALELKSTSGGSISFSREKKEKGKMIKFQQISGLSKTISIDNCFGGFLFNFREDGKRDNVVLYLSIENFNKFLVSSDKKSINKLDIFKHGGILVEGKKKKVRYKYDVKGLLEEIKNKNG